MTTSDSRAASPGFPWGLTVLSALALVLLLALGVWQVQRLQWKQGLIARADAAAGLSPVPIQQIEPGPDRQFRQVMVDCPGLATAPFVELQSIRDGEAGVRLISACPVEAGPGQPTPGVYLVDRGFISAEVSARPSVGRDSRPVRIIAVVRTAPAPGLMALPPSGNSFYARDNAAMAAALGVSTLVSAETLFATTSSNPDMATLQPSAPPVAFANNHLGYALTWFGLAGALIAFYVVLLRRRMRGG